MRFRRSGSECAGTNPPMRSPTRRYVRTMLVVVLKDTLTGKKTIFLSVHNVAGSGALWVERRLISLRREFAGIARLREATGLPVVFIGDFNDRSQAFYCKVLSKSLYSASVWWQADKTCSLPSRAGIDWIFGSPGVTFTGYQKQQGGLVEQASDHPFVVARVLR